MKYVCFDCSGSALQFTGSGRSVQCSKKDADRFESEAAAKAALKSAQETGGDVLCEDAVTTDGRYDRAVFRKGEK